MDHRGHAWSESDRNPCRSKDREDYYRHSYQDRGQCYPGPDPRDRDRAWAHPDAHYRVQFPPGRPPDHYTYSPQQYPYGYGRPEHQRPQSRSGYEYLPHTHWDYRENYSYYDPDHYRGQHGRTDAGQWSPQDSWRGDYYHARTYKQEHSGSSNTEENRHDQDTSHHYPNDYEDNPSRENEEVSSYYLGTLESSKNSGLSSSSYELSQYINGAEHSDAVPQSVHTADTDHGHQLSAPLKYSIPHAVVSFGPAGQLVRVTPGSSTQKNVSHLEIHSLEVILSETQEQQDMRHFPGPLTREDLHKVDAIEFAHQRAGACMRDETLHDKISAVLLWHLLILLCRQNGQIVGSDIAELLVQGSRSDGSWESDAPTLIDFSEGVTSEALPCQGEDLLTGSSSSSEVAEKALQSYTQLLLAGRKKEALEAAMSSSLWGHALFLASKMDNRSYTTVLKRFTGQLTVNDPLQTLFQLLSGRVPTAATCCGNEKWGDWRPHLAVMLSNETGDATVQQKAIITMGDTLASRGLLHAAHVCYLTAGVPFGPFTQKAERLVLLGSSHRQPFQYFATNSAIQCTELYEYCQTLGGKSFSILSFQVYKFLYACRLLDCGLSSQAFHYCELIGQAIIRQKEPWFVLTGEVLKLTDRLRHSEGHYGEAGVNGTDLEPEWLMQLRLRHHSLQTGTFGETYEPPPDNFINKDRTESDLDNLSRGLQSPEPELLYYSGPEVQEQKQEMTPLETGGVHYWPGANSLMPVTAVYAPPVSIVAGSQDISYHNTDSAEVKAASPHCPVSTLTSAAEGVVPFSGVGTRGGQMLEVDISHQTHHSIQRDSANEAKFSEQTNDAPKESTKKGWFGGWFKSKPKEVQETPEQSSPAKTIPPAADPCPPPPPTMAPPGIFPSQPSSNGINPFSRKAGQQLG